MIVFARLLVMTLSAWAKPAEQECAHVVKHGKRLLLLGIPPKFIYMTTANPQNRRLNNCMHFQSFKPMPGLDFLHKLQGPILPKGSI